MHASFEEESKTQERTIGLLRTSIEQKDEELHRLSEVAQEKEKEARDATEKLERQREVLRQNGQELVESQSKAADLEERLIQTEGHLINAKASWAEAEHEREILLGKMQMLDEILRS